MKDKVLKMALEALELLSQQPTDSALDYADNAINALRERLAQPEQEPESCNGRNCAASIKNDFEHSNECIVDTAKVQGWSHAPEAIKAATALEGAPAQPAQEPVDDYIASIIALRDMIDAQPVPDSLYFKDLAQPAALEVWMFQHEETGSVTCIINDGINTPELFLEMNPRYALIGSPNSLKRPWVGLTQDDTFEIAERLGLADVAWLDLMVAIEAKLKDKNNG